MKCIDYYKWNKVFLPFLGSPYDVLPGKFLLVIKGHDFRKNSIFDYDCLLCKTHNSEFFVIKLKDQCLVFVLIC